MIIRRVFLAVISLGVIVLLVSFLRVYLVLKGNLLVGNAGLALKVRTQKTINVQPAHLSVNPAPIQILVNHASAHTTLRITTAPQPVH